MSSLLMDQFTKALVHVFEVAIRYNLQLTSESVQYKKSTVGPDGCHGAIDDWVPFGLNDPICNPFTQMGSIWAAHLGPTRDKSGAVHVDPIYTRSRHWINLGLPTWVPIYQN